MRNLPSSSIRGALEVAPVVAVGDGDDGTVVEFRKLFADPACGLGCRRDDGAHRREQPPHRGATPVPVRRRRIDDHLVEGPGIPEAGDPGLPEGLRAARLPLQPSRRGKATRRSRRSLLRARSLLDRPLDPPARPGRPAAKPSSRPNAPVGCRNRLWARYAHDGRPRRQRPSRRLRSGGVQRPGAEPGPVSTVVAYPVSGRYLVSFTERWAPAPPTGGK